MRYLQLFILSGSCTLAIGFCVKVSKHDVVSIRRAAASSGEPEEPIARIQFLRGVDEKIVPTVSITRSVNTHKNAQQNEIFFTGTATFWFEKASALNEDLTQDRLITGMSLIDDEGLISTDDIHARFERGRPVGISAVLVLSNPNEWHRFMRFMKRFSLQHGLAFKSAGELDSTDSSDASKQETTTTIASSANEVSSQQVKKTSSESTEQRRPQR